MTPKETGKLLGIAALYDARKVDAAVVVAWHEIVGDLPFADAEAAVKAHYAESTERLMPAHVRERVRAIHADRLARNPVPDAPREIASDPAAYLRWRNEQTQRIASGEPALRALPGGGE